jgi:pyruvate dehydrogenase E1 component alpha subunit
MTVMNGPVQVLTPEGELIAHPEFPFTADPDEIRSLYRDMVLVRRLDTETVALQRQGEIGLWAPSLGQEAAQIGSARAMRAGDFPFPTYREHGVLWCRGIEPLEILAMYRGATHGGWDPQARKCGLVTIVIGNQVLHAVGYAMGVQLDGAEDAAIAYFGDGATSEGDTNEAFVFASVFNAPVVFFCQNNQWAISHPREKQTATDIAQRAAGFGFPGVQVDGNDVLAVLAVTRWALERARTGQGPTLIEAVTYRMAAHTTADDPTKYRMADEVEAWRAKDPIDRVRRYLTSARLADDAFFASVEQDAESLAELIRSGVRAMPSPDPDSMFAHVFVDPPNALTAQRQAFADYEASFEA